MISFSLQIRIYDLMIYSPTFCDGVIRFLCELFQSDSSKYCEIGSLNILVKFRLYSVLQTFEHSRTLALQTELRSSIIICCVCLAGPSRHPGAAGDDGGAHRVARSTFQSQPAVEHSTQPARTELQPSA